jgi:hypothetical protein
MNSENKNSNPDNLEAITTVKMLLNSLILTLIRMKATLSLLQKAK